MVAILKYFQIIFLSVIIIFSSLFSIGDMPKKVDMPELQAGELGQWVDPFIGTGGLPWTCSMLFPGPAAPFGAVKLSPDNTDIAGINLIPMSTAGYHYANSYIYGFSHTRLSGTGSRDLGNFRVTPAVGNADPACRLTKPIAYMSDQEAATAGYYTVYLPTLDCLVELTATEHVGAHRYTFGAKKDAHIFIDATSFIMGSDKDKTLNGKITVYPDEMKVEGEVLMINGFSGRYGGLPGYFVAQFDKPFKSASIWEGGVSEDGRLEAAGADVGANINFGSVSGEPIELKLGISFVSLENAYLNLAAETGGLDFEGVRAKTRNNWEDHLSRIVVDSEDEDIKTIFYTALYHSFMMPSNYTDANGQYLGFRAESNNTGPFTIGNTGNTWTYYTDMSLWDTFRTTHPLYTLIAPVEQRDFIRSLIAMADIGGSLPRWPAGGGYSGSMFGSPANMLISESYLKGITDYDAEKAYNYMKNTSDNAVPRGGRHAIDAYNEYGYIPFDVDNRGSVSSTLEYAWADWCIALLGEALGKDAGEVAKYTDKSMYYKNLWDDSVKYFRAKNIDGTWVSPFSPYITSYYREVLTMFPDIYEEGSAQHYRWSAPQDPQGLLKLFGSNEFFAKELDKFMSSASSKRAGIDPGPGFWVGNQHNMHAPYMFNEAGRQDLTQKWARWT
ncbi:MAG: GH92 family glycosyl hydrolase, partial [Oscillospiraceae bacterium]|nr:GH92 family glycosyl hydrolase [Oscillospiraceae bacterium]